MSKRTFFSVLHVLFRAHKMYISCAVVLFLALCAPRASFAQGLRLYGEMCIDVSGNQNPYPPDPNVDCLNSATIAGGQTIVNGFLWQHTGPYTYYTANLVMTGDTGAIVSGSTSTGCTTIGGPPNTSPAVQFTSAYSLGSHALVLTLVSCGGQGVPAGTIIGTANMIIDAVASSPPTNTSGDPDLGPCKQCEARVGAPINITNGNTWMQEHDYGLPGFPVGLQVTRTWNSLWAKQNTPEEVGIFGDSWRSTFEERLQGVRGSVSTLSLWRANGSVWQFTYDSGSQTFLVTDPPNEHATIVPNPTNTQFILTEKDGTQEVFSKQGDTLDGFVTQIIDRNGNALNLNWDQSITPPALTSVTDAAQRTLTFAHNPNSRLVTSISDAMGTIASYTYSSDGNNLLTSVSYPVSNSSGSIVKTYQYADPNSPTLISAVLDSAGVPIESHTYDGARRGLTSQRGAHGADLMTVAYPTSGTFGVQITNSSQRTSSLNYGYIGSRRFVMSGGGPGCSSCGMKTTSYFGYDAAGNRTSSIDARLNTTSYIYDANGNVTSAARSYTDSQGHVQTATWSYTYNQFGEVLIATEPLSVLYRTQNTYDTHGNLLSTSPPSPQRGFGSAVTSFQYDATGRGFVTQITDPLQHVTTIDYWLDSTGKPYGLIKHITDANGKQTYFEYDARGNRTLVQDALQRQTHYQYDGLNLVTLITYPDNTTKTFHYEPVRGHLDYVLDQNGKKTSYAYDDADRLTSVTDSQSSTCCTTNYGYDTEGNLTSITDALQHTTTFHYDPTTGLRDKTIYPASGQTQPTEFYYYDSVGNLIELYTRNQQAILYSYDELNRRTRQLWSNSNPSYEVDYAYDADSRLTSVQQITSGSSGPSYNTYGFSYDGMSRLTGTTTQYASIPGKTFTVSYRYDFDSNRTIMTDAEQGQTTYTYDALNRLTNIQDFNQTNFGFGYDDISRRTSLTRQNGVNTAYTYKPNTNFLQNILHQVSGTTVDGADYTYDNVGNRLTKTLEGSSANYVVSSSFTQDNIYQLLGVSSACPRGSPCDVYNESYTYDVVGNRLTNSLGSIFTYNNPWNRLDSVGAVNYTYDNNGNLKTKTDSTGTPTNFWDYENRIIAEVLPNSGGTVYFSYDPFGRRIQKKFTQNFVTTTTNYIYDGANIIEEVDASGNQLRRFTQGSGIDEPLAITQNNATWYYQADGLGSITSLTDLTGTVTDSYPYDSQGNAFDQNGNLLPSAGSGGNLFRFTGREYDPETGLYYYRARYYSPQLGRFISEDPLGFDGGDVNFYGYVGNDPVDFIDPSGLGRLPADPSGLGGQWVRDPNHRPPGGGRWTNPHGDTLEFHKGRPGEPGNRGKDHWHFNGGKEHLKPGDEVPVDTCEEPKPEPKPYRPILVPRGWMCANETCTEIRELKGVGLVLDNPYNDLNSAPLPVTPIPVNPAVPEIPVVRIPWFEWVFP